MGGPRVKSPKIKADKEKERNHPVALAAKGKIREVGT